MLQQMNVLSFGTNQIPMQREAGHQSPLDNVGHEGQRELCNRPYLDHVHEGRRHLYTWS